MFLRRLSHYSANGNYLITPWNLYSDQQEAVLCAPLLADLIVIPIHNDQIVAKKYTEQQNECLYLAVQYTFLWESDHCVQQEQGADGTTAY